MTAFRCPANVHVNTLHVLWSAIQPCYGGNDSQYVICSVFRARSFLLAQRQKDWWLLFRHARVHSVLLVLSSTGCRDLSGLWTERVCWDSSVLCPITLEIESVRCLWRFFVTAPAYLEHCLLHLLTSQGPGLGDTRDMVFDSCRAFSRAEEGAKGLPHLKPLCQGERCGSLTSVSYLPVSEANMRWRYKALLCIMVHLLKQRPEG